MALTPAEHAETIVQETAKKSQWWMIVKKSPQGKTTDVIGKLTEAQIGDFKNIS